MTCIIGLNCDKKIYIAGDSASSDDNGWGTVRMDTKVCRKNTSSGEMIIGFCSSYRYGQLLKYKWEVPKFDESLDFDQYLHTDFIDSIYELMNDNYLDDKNPANTELGSILIGFRGKLFCIEDDLQICTIHSDFSDFISIGCGSEIASGAMEALNKSSPKERLIKSLEITSKYFSSSVRGPFIIESINK